MASLTFMSCPDDVFKGNIDFDTDTFYMMLTNGYTPNQATHTKRSDVTNEATGTGYSAGGAAVTVSSVTKNTGAKTVTVTYAAMVWASSSITATGAVIYKRRGGASTADELVGYDDFGGTFTSVSGNFNVASCTITLTVTV